MNVEQHIQLKHLLESEKKYIEYVLENNLSKNKRLRETMLINNSVELSIIKNFLYDNCTHEWVSDDIDISVDVMKKIKYCEKCGLTHR
jgi:hypothetical protein